MRPAPHSPAPALRRNPLVLAVVLALVSAVFAVGGLSSRGSADAAPAPLDPPEISGPFVGAPVFPTVFDGSLADLPRPKPVPDRDLPIGTASRAGGASPRTNGDDPAPGVPTIGAAEDGGAAVDFSDVSPNRDGMSDVCCPEDPIGDAGPNHYIQMVNSSFQIFDKAGTSLAGPSRISTIWDAAGDTGACSDDDSGDPVVKYDHLADRWLLTQFDLPNGLFNAPSSECIAISQTADPVNGGWFLYTFRIPGDRIDYPKFGVWPDAYYMSSQQGYSGGSLDAWAWDRANMLNGTFVTPQRFTIAGPAITMLPADLDGPAPAAGTPAPFARMLDGALWGGADRVEIFHFHVDWTTPALSTFTMVASLPTTFDSDLCNGTNLTNNCVPQPGTGTLLETLSVWPMQPLQYRTFGTHDTLVFTHSVDADGSDRAGVRWYEVRRTPADVGPWAIFQGATHSPDAVHRWMGSAAMNGAGDIAVGYSVSDGTSVNPGIRYAGRLSTDPINTLPQGEFTLVDGGGTSGATRWGDYSAMSVDPVDDCTFWYTAAYVPAGGRSTRIGAFKFPSCVRTISIDDVTHDEGNAGTTAYTFTVSLSGPSGTVVTVDYDTADGSATTADGDYNAASGTVTFGPGDTSETVTVNVNGDTTFEPDEDFFVDLSNPQGADIADGQGRGLIRNDDTQPTISIDDVAQPEGDAGTTPFGFTVSLSNASFQTITVDFDTADGSAELSDNDYQAASGTVTFTPGDTSEPVTVNVNGDNKFEPDEDFFVNLSNPQNATIADGQGEGTIQNDDPQPTISINDASDFEGNFGQTPITFTGSLSNPSYQTITVDYATADGTATVADNDYQPAAGTLTFVEDDTSESLTVQANGDTTIEPDETFFVNLSNPQNATIADGQGQGTILNDDLSADVDCTITGTNKDDLLIGTPGNDVICGLQGDDELRGLGGHDVLFGNQGRDLLLGGTGNDLLLGDQGIDDLRGEEGNDTLRGGVGPDRGDGGLLGGPGSDALFGENSPDFLDTRDSVAANDLADGGSAPDTCETDPGDGRTSCESP